MILRKDLNMSRTLQVVLGMAFLTVSGCGVKPPPNMTPRANGLPKSEVAGDETLERVRKITSELLAISVDRLTADTTLADLGADGLDLVELTMELEEEFSTTIPDEAMEKLAGEGNWEKGMKKISIRKLAELVEEHRRTKSD